MYTDSRLFSAIAEAIADISFDDAVDAVYSANKAFSYAAFHGTVNRADVLKAIRNDDPEYLKFKGETVPLKYQAGMIAVVSIDVPFTRGQDGVCRKTYGYQPYSRNGLGEALYALYELKIGALNGIMLEGDSNGPYCTWTWDQIRTGNLPEHWKAYGLTRANFREVIFDVFQYFFDDWRIPIYTA